MRVTQLIIASLCLLSASASYLLTPRQLLAEKTTFELNKVIPSQFGEWRELKQDNSLVVSPEQDAVIKSIYSQVLSRSYIDSKGDVVMLTIAYTRDQSDNSGTQSHKPEICYPAQGFSIGLRQPYEIKTAFGLLPAVRLLATNGLRIEPVTYWTMVGEVNTRSVADTKIAQIKYGINNIIPDGLLFRTSMITAEVNVGYDIQTDFINSLLSSIDNKDRMKLSGL